MLNRRLATAILARRNRLDVGMNIIVFSKRYDILFINWVWKATKGFHNSSCHNELMLGNGSGDSQAKPLATGRQFCMWGYQILFITFYMIEKVSAQKRLQENPGKLTWLKKMKIEDVYVPFKHEGKFSSCTMFTSPTCPKNPDPSTKVAILRTCTRPNYRFISPRSIGGVQSPILSIVI